MSPDMNDVHDLHDMKDNEELYTKKLSYTIRPLLYFASRICIFIQFHPLTLLLAMGK
jgi:hypothetical protein